MQEFFNYYLNSNAGSSLFAIAQRPDILIYTFYFYFSHLMDLLKVLAKLKFSTLKFQGIFTGKKNFIANYFIGMN